MKLLLDTAAILIMVAEPRRLSSVVRQALVDSTSELFVSSLSFWEIGTKCSKGKLELALALPEIADQLIDDYQAQFISFSLADSLVGWALPRIHDDPFDRMLICQALSRDLVIVTPDRAIRQYDVPSIW